MVENENAVWKYSSAINNIITKILVKFEELSFPGNQCGVSGKGKFPTKPLS